MESLLIDHGLLALFILSFLAATIIPIGSEWLLVALLLQSVNVESAVAIATLGNCLGAFTTYAIGAWGADFLVKRVLGMDEKKVQRAESLYNKYGAWSLLLSWLPIVGDPLCLVGGVLRYNFLLFTILVFVGKLGRYSLVAALTLASMSF